MEETGDNENGWFILYIQCCILVIKDHVNIHCRMCRNYSLTSQLDSSKMQSTAAVLQVGLMFVSIIK